jgi:predicted type IV restriction endonuclease
MEIPLLLENPLCDNCSFQRGKIFLVADKINFSSFNFNCLRHDDHICTVGWIESKTAKENLKNSNSNSKFKKFKKNYKNYILFFKNFKKKYKKITKVTKKLQGIEIFKNNFKIIPKYSKTFRSASKS